MIVQSFYGLLLNALLAVLKAIVPAMTESTNLFSTGAYGAWESVLFISEALVSIVLVLLAYSLFAGVPIRGRVGSTRTLSRLAVAVVLMPFTLYMAQLVLDINDAMASYVLPYGELATYSSQVISKLGGYSVGAIAVVGVVVLLLYLVLIVRTLLVFFTAALLPLVLLCDVSVLTRPFSRKMLSLFLEMAFLPFFMSVALKIGIDTSSSTFGSLQVPSLIIAGTYLLPLLVPFLISPTGGRVMQYLGLPALGAAFTAASVAVAGSAAYAAGLISAPFRSAGVPAPVVAGGSRARIAFRHPALRNASWVYNAGNRHGHIAMDRILRGTVRAAGSLRGQESGRPAVLNSAGGAVKGVSRGHHRIYVGVSRIE